MKKKKKNKKKKAGSFLTPQIITPKMLPGQRCTFAAHTDDHHEFNPFYSADYDRLYREGKHAPARCAYVEPTEDEVRAASRKMMLDATRTRVIENALHAVSVMEHFLHAAKQRIAEVQANPELRDFKNEYYFLQLPGVLVHELSWGMANASMGVESALAAAQDFLQLEREPL